jgi:hypothetical protein
MIFFVPFVYCIFKTTSIHLLKNINTMKKILGIVFLGSFIFSAFAQQKGPQISFSKDVHDFGTIKEEAGKVSCAFEFANTGSEPLIINDVDASCGCTSPGYTKKPVLPGQKGSVSATFDPKGRPGHFSKSIYVTSNSLETKRKVLTIKGEVQPKQKSLAELYPHKMSELRLQTNHMGFGSVYSNDKDPKEIGIVNTSDKKIQLSFDHVPAHVELNVSPNVLEPNEEGVIKGIYDASQVDEWGMVINRAYVLINGTKHPRNRLTISANIKEDFSDLTKEELANAPHISFKEKTYNYGKAAQKSKVTHEFAFTNTGKSDLILRKIKSSCGCTVVKPDTKVLAPGESSSLKVVFNTGTRKGPQSKVVTVISNDPENSVERLYLKGSVQP